MNLSGVERREILPAAGQTVPPVFTSRMPRVGVTGVGVTSAGVTGAGITGIGISGIETTSPGIVSWPRVFPLPGTMAGAVPGADLRPGSLIPALTVSTSGATAERHVNRLYALSELMTIDLTPFLVQPHSNLPSAPPALGRIFDQLSLNFVERLRTQAQGITERLELLIADPANAASGQNSPVSSGSQPPPALQLNGHATYEQAGRSRAPGEREPRLSSRERPEDPRDVRAAPHAPENRGLPEAIFGLRFFELITSLLASALLRLLGSLNLRLQAG